MFKLVMFIFFQTPLHTPSYTYTYECLCSQVLKAAGFTNVDAQDRTDLFVQSLEKELVVAEGLREDFVKVFRFFFIFNTISRILLQLYYDYWYGMFKCTMFIRNICTGALHVFMFQTIENKNW